MVTASSTTPIDYRPDLDGLRGFAVIAVLLFHAFPSLAPAGFLGVDIFFVLSGFLITSLCVAQVDAGAFSFTRFYARRARRLFPALIVVLTAVSVLGWFTFSSKEFVALGRHVAAGAFFVPNIVLWKEAGYFDEAALRKPLLNLWSLGVEEQFYLVWPACLLWSGGRRRVSLAFAASALLASFALAVTREGTHAAETFYLLHARLWEPMAGAVLALLPHGPPSREPLRRDALSLVGVVCIVGSCGDLAPGAEGTAWAALPAVFGACSVILAGPAALRAQAFQAPPPASEGLPQPVRARDPLLRAPLTGASTAATQPSAPRPPCPPTRARTYAFAVAAP